MPPVDDAASNAPVDAVGRVLTVLRQLVEEGTVSVRATAAETGISRSAVQRLLARLAAYGVAAVDSEGRYSPGPLMLEWASRLVGQSSAMKAADRVMRQLVDEVDESVYLTVLIPEELRISFVHRVDCSKRVQYVVQLGSPGPLHAGAAGKAILAHLPPTTLNELDYRSYTDRTVTDRDALARELAEIRQRGYAYSIGERIPEAAGIAAPIFMSGRVVASLTLTIPQSRLRIEDIPQHGALVRSKAEQLTRLIASYPSLLTNREAGI